MKLDSIPPKKIQNGTVFQSIIYLVNNFIYLNNIRV
jgi:hypothetical protein